jgi:hypothetical protein
MLIPTNFELSSSVLRSSNLTIMQDPRKSLSIGQPTIPSQTRPSTDFSIEAIMGRNAESDRPSPQLATTAESATSPQSSSKGNSILSIHELSHSLPQTIDTNRQCFSLCCYKKRYYSFKLI